MLQTNSASQCRDLGTVVPGGSRKEILHELWLHQGTTKPCVDTAHKDKLLQLLWEKITSHQPNVVSKIHVGVIGHIKDPSSPKSFPQVSADCATRILISCLLFRHACSVVIL